MSFPAPRPGLVVRYSFLWSHEAAAGADEAVVATRRDQNGDIRTIVSPITHAPPDDPLDSIELPPDVCRLLKLDSGRHWLRLDELNRFAWPGHDLRPIPQRPGEYAYGMLPPSLFEALRQGILARQNAKRLRIQPR